MRLARRTAATTGIAWCAMGRVASAQIAGVAVDPHVVVLTPGRPDGALTVLNPHAVPVAFSVDLRFGYATSDSLGQPRVELHEGPDSASAADWVTPYPRTFTLAPGATRVVRLRATPPADLASGEYWARLTLHARDASPVRDDTASAPVLRLTMETATVLPVFFRKGAVSTAIEVDSLDAIADGDAIELRASLRRAGTAAFLGVAHIIVRDGAGRSVATLDRQFAVYRTSAPRWRVPLPHPDSAARYSVALVLSTNRRDVAPGIVLQAPPVMRVVQVRTTGGRGMD
jgi:P pilus assembly chaperone PapD